MTLLQGYSLQPLPLLCGIEVLPQPVPHRDRPDDPRGYDALDPALTAVFHEHRDFHKFPAPQIDRAHAVHINRLHAKRIDQAVPKRHPRSPHFVGGLLADFPQPSIGFVRSLESGARQNIAPVEREYSA